MDTDQVITVTWMDGKTEKYDHIKSYHVSDGMLTIVQTIDPSQRTTPDMRFKKTLHLSIANIRVWSE